MKILSLVLLLSVVTFLGSPEEVWAATGVKSYREWKNEQIQHVKIRIGSARNALRGRKHDPNLKRHAGLEGRDSETSRLENQLRNQEMELQFAQELTVSDYFAGYLAKMSDRKAAYKQVAGKLSPEEVAELMTAYANSVFGTQNGTLPASAQRLTGDPK